MPKVSVILPCFNVSKYIERAMNCLQNQTLPDIEIICVDDKSTDNTLELLHKLESQNKNMRVIALAENSGVSVARNTGVDVAMGEYIGFMDPDDYVDADFYEKLYNRAVAESADVCMGNIAEHFADGQIKKHTFRVENVIKDKCRFDYTMWCAIYKRKFILDNKIYCPVGITNGEDTVFCVHCAVCANKIVGITDTYYHYVRYENSAETTWYSEKQVDAHIKMAKAIVDIINKYEIPESDYKHYFWVAFWSVCYDVFDRTTRRDLHKKSLQCAVDIFNKCKYKSYFANPYIGPYLICGDADGLCEYLTEKSKKNYIVKISLFKLINLITVKREPNRAKIYVFGIPMFYVFWHRKDK